MDVAVVRVERPNFRLRLQMEHRDRRVTLARGSSPCDLKLKATPYGWGEMFARTLSKADYDQIVQVIDKWSAGPSAMLAHPIFFHQLGELAKVVEYEQLLVGFLFGFVAPAEPRAGYVHLVGIQPEFRRRGVARLLFESFEADCRGRGCLQLKSMTMPGNDVLVSFHHSLGWSSQLIEDYAGPGRPRILFSKRL